MAPGSDSISSSASSVGPHLSPMNEPDFPGSRFVQDGSDYFDLHHMPDDTLDRTDAAAMDKNVTAYLVCIWIATNNSVSNWGWPAVEQWPLTQLM